MNETDPLIIILSYNRPDDIITLKTLAKTDFDLPWVVLISDDDPQKQRYEELFPNNLEIFNKTEAENHFDVGDNFPGQVCVVWPRAWAPQTALKLGYRWFLALDDDYTQINYRFNQKLEYEVYKPVRKGINHMIRANKKFVENTGVLMAVTQEGEWFGGAANIQADAIKTKRKAMNWFMCDALNPPMFPGRINEDVNMYTEVQRRGDVIAMHTSQIVIRQELTQQTPGGQSEIYAQDGTYLKTMYSIMRTPSAVKMRVMGEKNQRLHHIVDYDKCAPLILNQKHKKQTTKK